MWYGEPETFPAPFPGPQSSCEAMCPPQVSTAVELVAVKVMERVWVVFPIMG
jgi:hypothetical protein